MSDEAIFIWGAVAAMVAMMAIEIASLIAREHLFDRGEGER